MNSQPFHSSEVRNVLATEFMRIAGCKRVKGEHDDYICDTHKEPWTNSGCLRTIDAANDLLIPILEVIKAKVIPT